MSSSHKKKEVFIIEDNNLEIDMLTEALREDFELSVYTNGVKAVTALAARQPDLVLLDVMLPGMDGYEICQRLKEDSSTSNIPVIFLTSLTMTCHERACLSMGADDYMRKPFDPESVRVRVHHQIERASHRRKMETQKHVAIVDLAVRAIPDKIPLQFLVTGVYESAEHIHRIKKLYSRLAESLTEIYPDMVSREDVSVMALASVFHDIGKVVVSKEVLEGGVERGDDTGWLQKHTTLGAGVLRSLAVISGESSFLAFAAEIAESHHERWDGRGYPHQLKGDEIPVSARIMAVVDFYDYLTSVWSVRQNQQVLSHSEAVSQMINCTGYVERGHFDPKIIEAFLRVENCFPNAWQKYIA